MKERTAAPTSSQDCHEFLKRVVRERKRLARSPKHWYEFQWSQTWE